MTSPYRRKLSARAFTLVEILMVLVIIAILSSVIYSVYVGKSGRKNERSYGPVAQSQTVVCKSNLQQIRTGIQMLHDSDPDGKYPASLEELKFPQESLVCPDGKEPYQYDPTTGQVHCIHPGHENF